MNNGNLPKMRMRCDGEKWKWRNELKNISE